MNPPPTSNTPARPAPSTSARARWTPDRQRAFLTTLLATGNVGAAADAVGMSRTSVYRLRQRLKDTPFDRQWSHALTLHAQGLADPIAEARRRRAPR